MAVKYFSKPVFLATVICVIFFYSCKELVLPKEQVVSLIPFDEISYMEGVILSSPAKSSSGKYYSCSFSPEIVGNKKGLKSSVKRGVLKLYIPTNTVEQYFPGKLYSSSKKKGLFFESGGHYCFTGKNLDHGFFMENCSNSYWDNSLKGKISYFRAKCRLHFKRLMYGWGPGGGLLLALLSGAREYTDKDTALAFKNAGLSHILALSGMHLSMFSAIALFFGKKIGRKKLSFIIRIIALILFVWFAGFSPSLLRAFICAMMIILASMAGVNQPDMVMILCFSFLLQSMINPADIYNMGFMLSYGALAGLLLTSSTVYSFYVKVLPTWLSGSLGASTGAQIFTAPITLKYFGTFSPIGIIATTIVSPLITIFIYTGLALIILTLAIPAIQSASGIFINLQYNIIKNLVIFFSRAPIWSLNESS